jgi:hypothetical protein
MASGHIITRGTSLHQPDTRRPMAKVTNQEAQDSPAWHDTTRTVTMALAIIPAASQGSTITHPVTEPVSRQCQNRHCRLPDAQSERPSARQWHSSIGSHQCQIGIRACRRTATACPYTDSLSLGTT